MDDMRGKIAELQAENAELRARFTKLDQPKYSGDPMLDAWLAERNPEFTAQVEKLPPTYWARYDLSAVRIGWELALRQRAEQQEDAKQHGEPKPTR